MTTIRRSLLALIAMVVAVTLAACASIPMSGPVEPGQPLETDRGTGVRYYPAGPISGASREEIVQGFISAGTGVQDNFATAREFLAPEVRSSWSPTSRVYITDGQMSMKSEGTDVITVSLPVYGRVGKDGTYVESISGKTETLSFRLEQIEGEWRISEVPDGIAILKQPFVDLFKARTLYFFGSAMNFLTPDVRWFVDDKAVASRATRMLVAGPAAWLADGGAVRSAFPEGVTLVDTVRVEEGNVIVNLSSEVSAADPDTLSLMRLQLEQTLLPILDASSVEMRVNGATLNVALPPTGTVITDPQVNSSPLVAKGGSIGYLSAGQLTLPQGAENVASAASNLALIRGALSARTESVAFLTQQGTWSMNFWDEEPTLVDARPGQIEPTLDTWGWVWTQSTTDPGVFVSRVGEDRLSTIELPAEVAPNFISFQVSRDGTRMAVLYKQGERVNLAIMAIHRTNGEPTALGTPLVIDMPGSAANDLAWVDANTVGMLVDVADGNTDIRLYRVGGELTSLGQIQSAAQITGTNTLAGMRVVDRDGTLYAPRGTGWQSSESSITFLFAQV